MNSYLKIICVIICIIIVVFLCKTTLFPNNSNDSIQSKELENEVENNILQNTENTSLNENTNIELENNIYTENVDTNVVENDVVLNTLVNSNIQSVYESQKDVGTTDKKQEAINMVKNEWGEDDTATFRCDSITSNGEYIIAVVSKTTASVQAYYRVNLENKTVEVDY